MLGSYVLCSYILCVGIFKKKIICTDDCDLQRLCLHPSPLSVQRTAYCEPLLTTSGSEKATTSLSVIHFAIHLHMYM